MVGNPPEKILLDLKIAETGMPDACFVDRNL
jgi:hypothetical protein